MPFQKVDWTNTQALTWDSESTRYLPSFWRKAPAAGLPNWFQGCRARVDWEGTSVQVLHDERASQIVESGSGEPQAGIVGSVAE